MGGRQSIRMPNSLEEVMELKEKFEKLMKEKDDQLAEKTRELEVLRKESEFELEKLKKLITDNEEKFKEKLAEKEAHAAEQNENNRILVEEVRSECAEEIEKLSSLHNTHVNDLLNRFDAHISSLSEIYDAEKLAMAMSFEKSKDVLKQEIKDLHDKNEQLIEELHEYSGTSTQDHYALEQFEEPMHGSMQIPNEYPIYLMSQYRYSLETFAPQVISYGRIHLKKTKKRFGTEFKALHGYMFLFFMSTEADIDRFIVNMAHAILGGKYESSNENTFLTSKMRRNDPTAVSWHKKFVQEQLISVKAEMERIAELLGNRDFNTNELAGRLVTLAYSVFAFEHSNRELSSSGNPAFPLMEKFPEVHNLKIMEWIFRFYSSLNMRNFQDNLHSYQISLSGYQLNFNRLNFPEPLAID